MLLSKSNLSVVAVASRKEFDRGLNGVRIEPDGSTVAGNGKVLMAVSPVDGARIHFPEVGERASVGERGVVLRNDHVEEALHVIPNDKRVSLQHVALTKAKVSSQIEMTTMSTTGRVRSVADAPKNDVYPDWKAVMRLVRSGGKEVAERGLKTGIVRVCVNRKELIGLLKAMESACPDKGDENPVEIEIGRGVVLRCFNRDNGQRAIGALNAYVQRGLNGETVVPHTPMNGWERDVLEEKAVTSMTANAPRKIAAIRK